jgi:protein-L-isoaspartate(D-aspartate) O-methyltransferase
VQDLNLPQRRHFAQEFIGEMSQDMLISLSMNFNNSGASHTELCDNLKKNNLISTPLLEYAFRKCDRANFDPSSFPYEDKPHDIGAGATISSAHMHCIALEAIAGSIIPPNPTESTPVRSFLDVGAGSGYVAGVMASVIHALRQNPFSQENGLLSSVVAVELHPSLAAQAEDNLRFTNKDFTDGSDAIVRVVADDAFSSSMLPNAPFDAIHCGVACNTTPLTLLAQLKSEGSAVVPVARPGSMEQDLLVFTRKPSDASSVDLIAEAAQVAPEDADAWLEKNFTRREVMRCVYSMAHDKAVSTIPVVNPRSARAPGAQGKYAKYFKGGEVDPGQKEAYEAFLEQQKQEMQTLIAKLEADWKHKQAELDKSSEEVKKWHAKYVEEHQRKPSLEEMMEDPLLSTMLRVVKELRVQVTKAERALLAAQKKV